MKVTEIEIFTLEDDSFGKIINLKESEEYELIKMPDNTFLLQAIDHDIGGEVFLDEFSNIDRIVFRSQ